MTVIARIFSEAHRVFFLAAAVYALGAIAAWEIWLLAGRPDWGNGTVPAHMLHGHEMIFGYGSAALAGFLLTAVPNWTGTAPVAARTVTALAALWLAGRVAFWVAGVPLWSAAMLDLAFLPALIAVVCLRLLQCPKPRNVVFIGFLSLLWLGNLMVQLDWLDVRPGGAGTGLRAGLLTLCAMIAVVGGRVTPAFTGNAMKKAGLTDVRMPHSPRLIDAPAIGCAVLLPLAVITGVPDSVSGGLAIVAGALQLLRLAFWRPGWALRFPIIWSLHLGVGFLGAGFMLWGAAQLGWADEVSALHVLGIGGVGGMTVAVMSRAILGHSGRALIAPLPVALSYALTALAALLRWAAGELSGMWYDPLVHAAGAVWIAAFACFVAGLWQAIATPRVQASQG